MGAVYAIIDNSTARFYIGSTVDPIRRKNDHFRLLSRNQHWNTRLQEAWNTAGKDSFTFTIIVCVVNSHLREIEQHYLQRLRPAFNTVFVAVGGWMLGRNHSLETKIKMSAGQCRHWERRRNEGTDRLAEEHKRKIAAAHSGKKASQKARNAMSVAAKHRKALKSIMCKKGHFWTAETTVIRADGGRHCRLCARVRKTQWMRQKRSALRY